MAPVGDQVVSDQRVLGLRPVLGAHVPVLTADHLGITAVDGQMSHEADDQKDDQKDDQAGDQAEDRGDDQGDDQAEVEVTVMRRLIH